MGKYASGASLYGCLDMAGNVWEWTSSLSMKYPYDAKDGRENLEGGDARVLRGGSFDDYRRSVRCASRYAGINPDNRGYFVGFRVLSPGI